jgi:hypothetical protein
MPFYPPNGSKELREKALATAKYPLIWQNRSGIVINITAFESDLEVNKY